MKVLKVLIGIIVAILALIALVVVLALVPGVQTWAVRKAVASQPGLTFDASRVAAGFTTANLDDVHYAKDGLVVTAKHVTAKYSAWDFITHRRVTVEDLAVEDLLIDARQTATPATTTPAPTNPPAQPERIAAAPQPASAKSQSQPFNGILTQIQLPFDVRVARFSVPGRALLPNDQTATFEVHGSDITTGQRGTVDWKVDLTNAQSNSPVTALHTSGTAGVHITTERRIDVADVNAIIAAEGAKLPPDQLKLEAKAEQPAAGGNEGYNVNLSMVHAESATPLLTVVAQYNASAHEITGAWTLTVKSGQVQAMLSGLGLPDVALDGSGKFSGNPQTNAASANGELHGSITHLEKISPDLAGIGSLRLQTNFDANVADNVARLEHFSLDATAADGRKLAQINALQRVGYNLADKRVTFADASADLARISIQALPLAWAQPFAKPLVIDSGDLSMTLAVAAAADGSHVKVTSVEPLQLRNLTVRNGTQKLADQLTLTVKPEADYSADRLQAQLNDLNATMPTGDNVTGRMTADIANLSHERTIAFTTDTQAKFVAALKPYLKADTGPLTVSTQSEGTLRGPSLHFAKSVTHINRTDGGLVASLTLLQPLTVNTQTNAMTAEKDGDVLTVELGQVPLAWAEGFVPDMKFAGQVAGGTIGVAVRSASDLTANVTAPITIRGVGVTQGGRALIRDVDVAADFTASKQGDLVHYDVRRLEALQRSTSLLKLAVSGQAALGAKPKVSAKGALEGDLGALAQQPVAATSTSLSRGTLHANFDANVADTIEAKARITAENLVAKQGGHPLGTAQLDVTAAVQPDGSSVLKIPFTLTNGARKSDLSIDGKLARSGNTINFDGSITSSLLVVDDLQPLAALAPASTPPAAGTPTTRPAVPAVSPSGAPGRPTPGNVPTQGTPGGHVAVGEGAPRDTQPFWTGFGGKVQLDLKQITYGKEYTISGLRGAATITPTQLALNSLEGKFKDQPFKVSTTIDFAAAQPKPYTLAAAANVSNFDVGAILQAANPKEKPTLETKVTVDAKINGHGNNLTDLTQNAYGIFDVNGSPGVVRVLGGTKGTVIGGLSKGLGLFGAVVQNSDTTVAISQLTEKLAELPFEKFTMHAERGADLNLKVSRIEFLSADTRLSGSGGITNQPGVPIQKQPMQFTFQLAGKEGMAFLLNRLKLLNGQQDQQGYYLMQRTFTIKGTPSNPDHSDLTKFLEELGTNTVLPAAAGALQKLLGR